MKRLPLVLLTVLALAAVAGVFFVIWSFAFPASREVSASLPATFPAAQPYEEIMQKALAAYNARDAATLFADFASTAVPAPSSEVHRALFEGFYKEKFGTCLNRTLSLPETEILPDRALLVWDAAFFHAKHAKLSANFLTENGRPKIVQLRIEKAETEK